MNYDEEKKSFNWNSMVSCPFYEHNSFLVSCMLSFEFSNFCALESVFVVLFSSHYLKRYNKSFQQMQQHWSSIQKIRLQIYLILQRRVWYCLWLTLLKRRICYCGWFFTIFVYNLTYSTQVMCDRFTDSSNLCLIRNCFHKFSEVHFKYDWIIWRKYQQSKKSFHIDHINRYTAILLCSIELPHFVVQLFRKCFIQRRVLVQEQNVEALVQHSCKHSTRNDFRKLLINYFCQSINIFTLIFFNSFQFSLEFPFKCCYV